MKIWKIGFKFLLKGWQKWRTRSASVFAFRLFVVRSACFGWRALCCRFAFHKLSAVCLRYQKQKIVFPLPDVFRFGLDAKTHRTLTTLYISRILILYIYRKFISSRDKKGKIDALERPTRGKPLFSVSKISKVKNSAKTVNINQFEKIHPATIKISNPGGVSKNLHYRAKIPKSQKISLQP